MPLASNGLVVSAVAAAGGLSVITDLAWRRVPNVLTVGTAAIGLLLAARNATSLGVLAALEGLSIGLLLMLPGFVIGATGGGDVKLFAALGTLLGPSRTAFAFLYTAILGGLLAVAIAWRRKRLMQTIHQSAALLSAPGPAAQAIEAPTQNNRFAYAPAIALGALAAALGL